MGSATLWLIVAVGLIAVLVVGVAGWIRTIPISAETYHEMAPEETTGDHDGQGRFQAVRRMDNPDIGLARIVEVADDWPRTERLAGSVADGHVSYVTRSRVFGFPDITNVWVEGDTVQILGHLVFGAGDMGVNRRRVLGWLDAAGIDG